MEESLNVHAISEQIIGEVPVQMEWVYGVSDILIITLIVVSLLTIFTLPLKFFK